MEYTAEDKSIETRFFRLERFRVDTTQDAARSGTRGWSKLSFDTISAASQSTEPRDSVRVSDQLSGIEGSVLPKDYKLVCEFNVATGTITLLEALVIADTLSKRLIKYSNLVHMCQFSTANLFLILKAIASERQGGDLDIQNGPAMREAGSFAGLALVNAHTGRPEPAFLSATDAQLKKMCSSMLHRRVAEEKANLIMGMIRADIQLLSGVVIGDVASSAEIRTSGASENDVSPGSIGPQAREAFEALRTQIRTKCESIKATASVPAQ
ncbi:hypothetical protein BKA62DRAFT_209538 [Auriculariales sp. MPI-PUGE-AT-0066]|nr:hypothetical protein BKA62DRAFT_209538 [Auriculariales sp. MPI-PUGE-AT-0066]